MLSAPLMSEENIAETARAIYNTLYGDTDNKFFKAKKIAEIETWLLEGDAQENEKLADLADEWKAYDR